MTRQRFAVICALSILLVATIGAGVFFFKLEPIPDLGTITVVDEEIYDDQYRPVIEAISQELDEHRQSLVAPSISTHEPPLAGVSVHCH